MCPALGVTRQGHYVWRRRGPSARDLRDAELARLIPEVYESSRGIYGAPRVHMELRQRPRPCPSRPLRPLEVERVPSRPQGCCASGTAS